MRAKAVNENVNFERGHDPKVAMGIGSFYKKYIDAITEMAPKYGMEPEEHYRWDYLWSSDPDNFGRIGNKVFWIGISIEEDDINISARVRNKNIGGPNIGWRRNHLEYQEESTYKKPDLLDPKWWDRYYGPDHEPYN